MVRTFMVTSSPTSTVATSDGFFEKTVLIMEGAGDTVHLNVSEIFLDGVLTSFSLEVTQSRISSAEKRRRAKSCGLCGVTFSNLSRALPATR